MYVQTHKRAHTHRRVSQVVGDFISSVLEDRQRRLTTSDYRDDPLVQQCTVLHQKLKGLQHTLEVVLPLMCTRYIP